MSQLHSKERIDAEMSLGPLTAHPAPRRQTANRIGRRRLINVNGQLSLIVVNINAITCLRKDTRRRPARIPIAVIEDSPMRYPLVAAGLVVACCGSLGAEHPWSGRTYAYEPKESVASSIVEAILSCERGPGIACPGFEWLMVEKRGRSLGKGLWESTPLQVTGQRSFQRRSGERVTLVDWHQFRRLSESEEPQPVLNLYVEQSNALEVDVTISGNTVDRSGFGGALCGVAKVGIVRRDARWQCR
jgi:hypothetical protein